MSLPAGITTQPVSCTYVDSGMGKPCTGHVIFESPRAVTPAGVVIVANRIVAHLDANGKMQIDLACTNDPGTLPLPRVYIVYERVYPGTNRPPYALAVPFDGGPIDLATAAPVPAEYCAAPAP